MIQRRVVQTQALPQPALLERELDSQYICVLTDDGGALTIQLARTLQARQWRVVILSFPKLVVTPRVVMPPDIDHERLEDMGDDSLESQLSHIAKTYGPIGALVHLTPLDVTVASARAILKQVFLMAKYLKPSINQAAETGYGCFVTVTRLDGALGTRPALADPTAPMPINGGLLGLTKSLNLEWNQVFCRGIDLSPDLDVQVSVEAIVAELYDPNRRVTEVGYGEYGRVTLVAQPDREGEPLMQPSITLNRDSVVLVSGGGRGITAHCAIRLARCCPCTFILVGRSSLVSEPEWAAGSDDEGELKKRAIAHFSTHGNIPKPVVINQQIKQILAQREIQQTLQAIEQTGGKAIYLSVDITNKDAVSQRLGPIVDQYGSIASVIHGAGVLADKLIEKKTAQDFERVYTPKIIGLQNLLNCLNVSQLQQLILFSSAAGFYGNVGQTDYAIANEILNKFAYRFQHQYPHCHVVSLNWGPWDGGMVTPALKRAFEQRNIALISLQQGAQAFIYELSRGPRSCPQALFGNSFPPPDVNLRAEKITHRLRRTLTLQANPFLRDHSINRKPVLPMACAIDWAIQTCEQLYPGYTCFSLDNFKVLNGIIFDERITEVQDYIFDIRTRKADDGNSLSITVLIFSQLETDKLRYHYSGDMVLFKTIPDAAIYHDFEDDSDPSLAELNPYQDGTLFHGESFQGIRTILNISSTKITLECSGAAALRKINADFVSQHLNLEAADVTIRSILADIIMQSGLVWLQHFHHTSALPSRTGLIQIFRELPLDESFYVSTEILSCENHKLVANIISHDQQGLVYFQVFNVEATISQRLQKLFRVAPSETVNQPVKPTPVLFTKQQIDELCTGSVANCFGPEYAIYDQGVVKSSRLPNGELNLLHRVLSIEGDRHDLTGGATIVTEYDTPANPWYYCQNSSDVIPYSILMEIALQPCGFLSAYLGTTFLYPTDDLYFRNLDGEGTLLKTIDLRGKTITNTSRLLSSVNVQEMILQKFSVELACQGERFYVCEASFGHFSTNALAKQVGLDRGQNVAPWSEQNQSLKPEIPQKTTIDLRSPESQRRYYKASEVQTNYRLAQDKLNLIHGVKIIENGGQYQQGYIYAYKDVQPDDWYFKCHFFQDPVMPGSLGIEAIMQALQVYALHLDLGQRFRSPQFTHLEHHQIIWKYRGQIPQPSQPQRIYLEIHISYVDISEQQVIVIGDASLWKQGMRIYEAKNIGLCITESSVSEQVIKCFIEPDQLRISQLQIASYPF